MLVLGIGLGLKDKICGLGLGLGLGFKDNICRLGLVGEKQCNQTE